MTAQKPSYTILFLGRLLTGIVFAYSGYTKLMEPVENFQAGIAAYEVIPYMFIPWIARIVPWIEFLFGIFITIGYMTRLSALVLGGMSLSFVILIAVTWIVTQELPSDCGCFGEGSFIHFAPYQILLLDIVMTETGVKLFLIKNHPASLDNFLNK